MYNLRAFKTSTGYQVTNGPIVVDLGTDFEVVQSNTSDIIILSCARSLAMRLARHID